VVITYQDRWTWDFADHMVYLIIGARNAFSNDMIATVSFNASVPLREPAAATVDRLVDRLLENNPAKAREGIRPEPDALPPAAQKKHARE
jgi:hypothetical protein